MLEAFAVLYIKLCLFLPGCTQAVLHNFAGRPSLALEAAQQGYFLSFPPEIVRKPEVQLTYCYVIKQRRIKTLYGQNYNKTGSVGQIYCSVRERMTMDARQLHARAPERDARLRSSESDDDD